MCNKYELIESMEECANFLRNRRETESIADVIEDAADSMERMMESLSVIRDQFASGACEDDYIECILSDLETDNII